MKWKDSGESVEKEAEARPEFFDEEQYSPWAERKEGHKFSKKAKPSLLLVLLACALVVLVVTLVILLNGNSQSAPDQRIADLERQILQVEERLSKYDTIDEKVTRIWEQAQSFEKFKDRFDRSEASMSLRLDQMTLRVENIQKQLGETRTRQARTNGIVPVAKPANASKIQYHEVAAGDTLFSISKRYDLNVEALLQMNRMGPDAVIQPGQKLIVRTAGE